MDHLITFRLFNEDYKLASVRKDSWNETTSLTVPLLGRWSGGHDVYDGTGKAMAGLMKPSWSEFNKWFLGGYGDE